MLGLLVDVDDDAAAAGGGGSYMSQMENNHDPV